jgi:hypothetical protein
MLLHCYGNYRYCERYSGFYTFGILVIVSESLVPLRTELYSLQILIKC